MDRIGEKTAGSLATKNHKLHSRAHTPATRSKLLGAPGLTTRSKDATRGPHRANSLLLGPR